MFSQFPRQCHFVCWFTWGMSHMTTHHHYRVTSLERSSEFPPWLDVSPCAKLLPKAPLADSSRTVWLCNVSRSFRAGRVGQGSIWTVHHALRSCMPCHAKVFVYTRTIMFNMTSVINGQNYKRDFKTATFWPKDDGRFARSDDMFLCVRVCVLL